jgi:hypothetical protein
MTPKATTLNSVFELGKLSERGKWRPLYQMLHSLEPELRIGRKETVDKGLRARDAHQHDLVLKLLEMTPDWPSGSSAGEQPLPTSAAAD